MAEEFVEENYDDPYDTVMTDTNGNRQSLNNVSSHQLSSPKISKSHSVVQSNEGMVEIIPEIHVIDDQNSFSVSDSPEKKTFTDDNAQLVMTNLQRKSRSSCWARSRDPRKCQMHFREMIGKHEIRNVELEQREGDLRERLDMLECSMPAVMVWNVLRTTQGASPSTIRRLMEKQFKGVHPTGNIVIPSTPSQHYDCRVREIEAERKEAFRRAEEARVLLLEKEAAVEERQKRLTEAKKCNQEKMERMEKLNRKAAEMRVTMKKARGDDKSIEIGECGETRCKQNLLDNVGSLSSIGSGDLECFAKLQELAESEVCMKRQIIELERREEAYMRTLQEADELWSKMEDDSVGSVRELQEQLRQKAEANQELADRICQLEDELEKLKRRLIGCKDALEKFVGKEAVDAAIGFEDGEAGVVDRGIAAVVKTATTSLSVAPDTIDEESTVHPETMDQESSIAPESTTEGVSVRETMIDKASEAIVDRMEREVDRPTGFGIDASIGSTDVSGLEDLKSKPGAPQNSTSHAQMKTKIDYNDDEEISDELKNWNWDEGCPPTVICNDLDDTNVIQSPTTVPNVSASLQMVGQAVGGHKPENVEEIAHETQIMRNTDPSPITKATEHMKTPEGKQIILLREELRNWYNIVDSIHHTIAKCANCSSKINLTAQLAEKMRNHLWMKALTDGIEPIIDRESSQSLTHLAKLPSEILRDLGHEPSEYTSSPPLLSATAMHLDIESVSLSGGSIVPDLKDNMKLSRGEIETEDISIPFSPVDASTIIPKSILGTPKSIVISDEFLETTKSQEDTTGEKSYVAAGILSVASLQLTPQVEITKDIAPLDMETKDYEEKLPQGQIETEDISNVFSPVDANIEIPNFILDTPKPTEISGQFLEITKLQKDITVEQPDVPAIIQPVVSLQVPPQDLTTEDVEPLARETKDYESKLLTKQIETEDISIVSSSVDVNIIIPKSILDTPKATEISNEFLETTESEKDTTVEEPDVAVAILPVEVPPQVGMTEDIEPLPTETKDYEEKSVVPSVLIEKKISGSLPEEHPLQKPPELESHSPEASMEIIAGVHVEKELSNIPKDETLSQASASFEESEKTISVQQEVETGFKVSTSRFEIPIDVPPLQAEMKQLIIEDEMALEHDAQLKEMTGSLIITRTPTSSESEVKPEPKESSSSLLDLKDELQLPLASGLIPELIKLSESKIDETLSMKSGLQDGYGGIFEAAVETLPLPSSQEFATGEVSVEKEEELEQPSVTILSEAEKREPPLPSAIEVEKAIESKAKAEEPVAFDSDRVITPEKIPYKEKMMEVSERRQTETDEQPQLPESVDPCICKPPPCYLLSERRPEAMKTVPKLDTDETQTLPQFPRTLDRLQLKTITQSNWPSADLVMRRRPLIWSRRPRDTSRLMMVCVDTQTDSADVRARTPRRRINRKDDCTCSSVSPKKTDYGDHEHVSHQRTDDRSPAPISLTVAEFFGSPRLQSSMTSTMEKEISFVKYTRKSGLAEDNKLSCVECGRPVTPEGTPLSVQSSLRTSTNSQKSLIESLKKMTSSSKSRIERKKNDFTCCECKTSDEVKAKVESRKKKELEKKFNRCVCDKEVCCPCQSEDTAKMTGLTSKSRRKKRKPEMMDQSVMAHIPTSKLRKKKEKITTDNSASKVSAKGKAKELTKSCYTSSRSYSGSFVADCLDRISSMSQSASKADTAVKKLVTKVSSPNDASKCGCDEASSAHVPYTKYSSIFKAKINKDESACSCGIGKSQKEGLDATCNCSSIESTSKEESSCNCMDRD